MKNLIILLFICSAYLANAQTITGKVINENQEPIEFVTITILNSDSTFVKGSITDSLGIFKIESLSTHQYLLQASFIGFENFTQSVKLEKDIELLITLKSGIDLKEVNVTGRKPTVTREIDRMVFDVSNSIVAIGGSAWETLGKAPMVRTDLSGNVMVSGRAAMILIDDKPIQMSASELQSYLESIPSEDIAKIEIITNPPAKYDAQGGVLINIVSKKNRNLGWKGNLSGSYTQGVYDKYRIGTNLNYRSSDWNIYGNYSHRIGKIYGFEQEYIHYNNANETSYWNLSHQKNYTPKPHTYKLGADFNINKNHVIGARWDGYETQALNNRQITTSISANNETVDSSIFTNNTTNSNSSRHSFNLNYNGKLDTLGKTLNIDLDYTTYRSDRAQSVLANLYNQENILQDENIDWASQALQQIGIYSLKADYSHPLTQQAQFSAGFKFSGIRTDNNLEFQVFQNDAYVNDTARSNHFIYDENIQALYANYRKSWAKFDIQIGLRGEYTQTKGNSLTLEDVVNRDYLRIFPTFYALYRVKEGTTVDFSYGRRIQRPSFWALNPFQYYTSPSSYMVGNPFLRPASIHNGQLNFTFKHEYFIGLDVRMQADKITQISEQIPETETLIFKNENVDNSSSISLFAVVPIHVRSWWEVNTVAQVSWMNDQSQFLGSRFSNQRFQFYGSVQNSFTLSQKHQLSAELSGWYVTKGVQGTMVLGSTFDVSMGFKKRFANNRGTISVAISDLFYSNASWIRVDYLNQQYGFIDQRESRTFRLSLSWRLGNDKVKNSRRRKTGNDEEKGRI